MKKLSGYLILLLGSFAAAAAPERSLTIGCSPEAPAAIQEAVKRLAKAADIHPTLKALKGSGPLRSGPLASPQTEELAYANLVLVGLPSDPLIREARQYAAEFGPDRSLYVFGFGRFRGDLGYLESGSNPWLHSEKIARLPFETNLIVLSGTTPKGVALAVEAFVQSQLVNGVVGDGQEQRLESTLLDRAPSGTGLPLPERFPRELAGWTLLGVTDCGADVGRGLLHSTGLEPEHVLLLKYFRPDSWDGPGYAKVVDNYLNGLDRSAYGNALLLAIYPDSAKAEAAAAKLAADRRLAESRNPEVRKRDYGSIRPVETWSNGRHLLLSTLPAEFNGALRQLK